MLAPDASASYAAYGGAWSSVVMVCEKPQNKAIQSALDDLDPAGGSSALTRFVLAAA